MGLSNDEVNAILRLRDDLQRAIGANQGSITAALMAADQVRDIVNLPALRQMQEMHGRDLLYLRELGDASSRIESQFGIAHAKALADAFVGLKVFDSEQFSPDISAGIAEQLKLLNSTVDHLAGLKALMPPDPPVAEFVERYNQCWRLEKLAYRTPLEAREQYELRHAA